MPPGATSVTSSACAGAASAIATARTALLRDAEAIHMDFEEMVDTNAVNPVGLDIAARHGIDHGTVDHVVDLVARDPNLQRVGRLPVAAGFSDCGVRRLFRDVGR